MLAPHDCGFLVVPEDRSDPDGPPVRLFYLHVLPAGGSTGTEPIASLGYEVAQSPSYASVVGIAETSGREFYLLDQRGVGHSEPSLACPEVTGASTDIIGAPIASGRAIFIDAVAACRQRLIDSGVHLGTYTIGAVADDFEALRTAVGVASWNVISWGTTSRFLFDYAARFPDGAHAVVMDSPLFPGSDPVSGAATELDTAFGSLALTCGASARCERKYPELTRAFTEAATSLDGSPAASRIGGVDVAVDGAALVRVVRHLLAFNDEEAWGEIPRLVYRALDGDVAGIAAVLRRDPGMCIGYLPRCNEPVSLGAYLSFICPEVPRAVPVLSNFADAYGAADPYLDACRIWNVPAAEAKAGPASVNVPTLVLRGEYDAFSPLSEVQELGPILPDAHLILVPYLGHDVFGTYDCLRDARNIWLRQPLGSPEFDPCLRTIPAPTFR